MRTVLYIAASIDGRIADATGGVAWLDPYFSDELGFHEFFANVGTVIMGRTTYDQVHGFGEWPYAGKRSIVLTSRPMPETEHGIESYNGRLVELVPKIKAETPGDIWIVGGAQVGRSFLEADLLDELEIYIIPVILGQGTTLFGAGTLRRALTLIEAKRFENGVIKSLYHVK
ncbi:MAG: dihydrofolate reductase [Ignavibacteriae bacterium]|nr:MAG: dihydrofolate reductase [Ignavibacteriota bacterium]